MNQGFPSLGLHFFICTIGALQNRLTKHWGKGIHRDKVPAVPSPVKALSLPPGACHCHVHTPTLLDLNGVLMIKTQA